MRSLGFEKLDVWKKSSRLSVEIVKALKGCRNYGFVDQLTRSSLSIPSNISEGEERETVKESARFLYFSKGSCGEVITQLYIGIELGYIPKEQGMGFIKDAKHISVMLAKMIKLRKGTVR
ncbi:four helix bundle protein [Photobacterium chitinilyticum]|uniref:Four helix bundle protein n=1 Tax=Photobacterium chitinilyticum TaxID=2485123 RepID=A0A3S3RAV0_9GAMM|nr:four helix bundle protein [Photobacterium chitinilyticum]RWX56608.1 four helix bundle protein [Photobacterium chitinilyticum]